MIELGFLPVAYVPCGAFHDTERLDLVKMARLRVPLDIGELELIDDAAVVAELVVERFARKMVQPRIARALPEIALFRGLDPAQALRVAGECSVQEFEDGDPLFEQGASSREMFLVLEGEVEVRRTDTRIGKVVTGDVVGELSVMTGDAHSAGAYALGR